MSEKRIRDTKLMQNRQSQLNKRAFDNPHRKFVLTIEEQERLEYAITHGLKGKWSDIKNGKF